MKQKSILITIFLLSLFSALSAQQKTALVSGKVITADGEPAEAISVFIENTTYGTTTDRYGKFQMQAPTGKHTLVVYSFWAHRVEVPIEVFANIENHIPPITIIETSQHLGEVVVTGTKTEKTLHNTPILTKVVTSHDIIRLGSTSAFDALQSTMPGIQFAPDGHGNNMTIQGLDNDYVLVLVDGERMVGETRGNVNLDRISAMDIKQIEIVSGASSVLYGSNAIGGVINIITKDASDPFKGNVKTRYSRFNTWNSNVNVSGKQKNFSFKLNAFRNSSDGYDLTPETPETYTANPYVDYSVGGRATWHATKKLDVQLNGTYFTHDNLNPPLSIRSTHKFNKNTTLGGRINYKISDKHFVTIGANTDKYNSFNVFHKYNDSTALHADYRYTSFNITDRYQINKKIEMVSGVEYNMEEIFSQALFGTEGTDKDKRKYSNDLNIFTQADWKPINKLELVGGLRYTRHSTFGNHFSPKLSAMYSLNPLKFRATGALGYKSPSLRELYYSFDHHGMFYIYGNQDLKPENSAYVSFSTEYTKATFNLSVNLFYNEIQNKIGKISTQNTVTDKLEYNHYNIDNVTVKGIESYLSWSFLRQFKLKAGYAYSDAIDESTGLQIFGNSKHTGTTSLTFYTSHKRYPLSVTMSGRIASPRLYQLRQTDKDGNEVVTREESEAFSIWRINYLQRLPIWKNITTDLQVGIDNIFDYKNTVRSAAINPGRMFWGALTVNF